VALDLRRAEGVLKRLLEHVADPAGGGGDQHAERKRLHFAPRDLVPGELVAHLRPVAMHDRDAPTLARQLHDRRDAFARVPKLIGDRGRLAGAGERVPAEREDRGSRHA
jgi:hypothetical protein